MMKIAVPIIEHFFRQILGAHQPWHIFTGQGEVPAINLTQEILACDRHVFRVAGTYIVVAFVGTGPAAYTDVHEHLQGPEFIQPLLESLVNDLLPVFG